MPITSIEQGKAEIALAEYSEEASPINAEIRALNHRLKVYEGTNWESLEPVLAYWKEHFRDSYVNAKNDEERHIAQGKCLAIEEVLGGKKAILADLNDLVARRDELRQRYGMEP